MFDDIDCFIPFAKLFQSRIAFEKQDFKTEIPMNLWYEERVVSSKLEVIRIVWY